MTMTYDQLCSKLWNARYKLTSAENEANVVTETAKHVNDAYLRHANELSEHILQQQDIIWKDRVLQSRSEVVQARRVVESIEAELRRCMSSSVKVVNDTKNDAMIALLLADS